MGFRRATKSICSAGAISQKPPKEEQTGRESSPGGRRGGPWELPRAPSQPRGASATSRGRHGAAAVQNPRQLRSRVPPGPAQAPPGRCPRAGPVAKVVVLL